MTASHRLHKDTCVSNSDKVCGFGPFSKPVLGYDVAKSKNLQCFAVKCWGTANVGFKRERGRAIKQSEAKPRIFLLDWFPHEINPIEAFAGVATKNKVTRSRDGIRQDSFGNLLLFLPLNLASEIYQSSLSKHFGHRTMYVKAMTLNVKLISLMPEFVDIYEDTLSSRRPDDLQWLFEQDPRGQRLTVRNPTQTTSRSFLPSSTTQITFTFPLLPRYKISFWLKINSIQGRSSIGIFPVFIDSIWLSYSKDPRKSCVLQQNFLANVS